MAVPAVTYTFTNGTTSDATQVNTNFTNVIGAMTDGTADFTIGTISVAGAATFNGAVTLGNATADDLTFTGNLASSITVKTNATYNLGSSTSALLSIYLGNGANKTTRIIAGTVGTSWTFTLPNDVPSITGQTMVFNTSGTAEFRYPDKFTASKTSDYTATGDETVILCDATSASFTVTLPAASTMTGKELTIIKTNSALDKTVTIDANSTETIIPSLQSGQLTYILYTVNESVTLKCNGTSWYVVAHYAQTDWIDAGAIPTIGAITTPPTKGTMVTDKVYWRRSGTDAIIKYRYESSAGGASGSGAYLFSTPSTFQAINTTVTGLSATAAASSARVESSSNVLVSGKWGINSSSEGKGWAAHVYSTTQVVFQVQNGLASVSYFGSALFGLAAAIGFEATIRVPISGWNP